MTAQPQESTGENFDYESASVVHQTLRREVNEQISTVNAGFGIDEGTIDVMCECGHTDCRGRLLIGFSEYEAVRRFPTRFLVKAGHDVSEIERVVSEADGYVVVEKVGRGGSFAVGVDPRRRSARRDGAVSR